uniref:Uncharacterized protein n=1 Tax=Schizaphis graminum TaxID=13262 RepID=A0A2S2PU12_SCHGA
MLLYCVRFDASTQYYSSSNNDRRSACAAFNHQFVRRPARGFFVNYSCAHLLLVRRESRDFFENLTSVPRSEYVHSRANNMISSPRGDHGRRTRTRSEVEKPAIA